MRFKEGYYLFIKKVFICVLLSESVSAIIPDARTSEEIFLLLSEVGSTEDACPLLHKKWHDRRVRSLPPNSSPIIESYNAATIKEHPAAISFWCRDTRAVADIPEYDVAGLREAWHDGPWILECSPPDLYSVAIFDKRIKVPTDTKDYSYERRTIGQCVLKNSEQEGVVPPGFTACFNVLEVDNIYQASTAWFSRSGKRQTSSNVRGAIAWTGLEAIPGKRPRGSATTLVSDSDIQYLEVRFIKPGIVYRACGHNPRGQPDVIFHIGVSRTRFP